MTSMIDRARRNVADRAISGFLAAAGPLPPSAARLSARAIGSLAGAALPLRSRLKHNLTLALGSGQVPDGAIRRYFRNFGILAGLQARTFGCRRQCEVND